MEEEQRGEEEEDPAKTNRPSWKPASFARSEAFSSFQHALVVIAFFQGRCGLRGRGGANTRQPLGTGDDPR